MFDQNEAISHVFRQELWLKFDHFFHLEQISRKFCDNKVCPFSETIVSLNSIEEFPCDLQICRVVS